MQTIERMPGNWPLLDSRVDYPNELRVNTNLGQGLLQIPTMASTSSSSRSSQDELFFDCRPSSTVSDSDEEPFPSYLVFEPVVESVASDEPTDWRRYEPPRELLHLQDGNSTDIQELLPRSIERIQARHAEEEERRIAAARRERPIARVGRASIKPRRELGVSFIT